jgi:SHS2 domain-containing protein
VRSFEFISHTAEAGLHLQADSIPELFRAGLEGMAEWLKPGMSREAEGEMKIVVESAMPETMLVDFLVDALTQSHIRQVLFFDARFEKLEAQRAEVTLIGCGVDCFDDDIKAITYHGAGIRRTKTGHYETEVIFDV